MKRGTSNQAPQPPWAAARPRVGLPLALALSVLAHILAVTAVGGGWGDEIPAAIRRIELELVAGLQQAAQPVADQATPEGPAPMADSAVPSPAESPVDRDPSPPARPRPEAPATAQAPDAAAPAIDAPSTLAQAESNPPDSDGLEAQRLAREAALRLDYLAWLERYKVYPVSARRRGVEGMVRVRFVVDRDGRLVGGELVESSGSRHLDRAALDLLERASPFPALPVELSADRLEMELPIEYRLVGPHRT